MSLASGRHSITLKDIACQVGVSEAAVSLALRNDSCISKKRRDEIIAMATRLRYRPNATAVTLAHQKHSSSTVTAELAWINHWPDPLKLRNHREFDLYWQGAFECAEKNGYRLEEFLWNKALSIQRVAEVLLSRGIRGILIPPHRGTPLEWRSFPWHEFSVVKFGYSVPQPDAHIVTSHQAANGRIAFQEIEKRGYSRIGFVTNKNNLHTTMFMAGFALAQQISSLPKLPALVIDEELLSKKECETRLLEWFKRQKPDAIFTDVSSLQQWLLKANLRVPKDVAVGAATIHDIDADAGIDQQPLAIGMAAVEMLITSIHHNECGLPDIRRALLIEGVWVDGSTLPNLRKKG